MHRLTLRHVLTAALAVYVAIGALYFTTHAGGEPNPTALVAHNHCHAPAGSGLAPVCSHGVDEPLHVNEARARLAANGAPATALPTRIPCTPDDGGPVVRVFYGYTGTNDLDRGSVPVRAVLTQAVAVADKIVADAGRATGGVRHVRWHTPGCTLSITPLRMAGEDPWSFFDALEALQDRGDFAFSRPGDKILVFARHEINGITCGGQGLLYEQDTASSSNVNNSYGAIAYVSCGMLFEDLPWDPGEVVAHELMHTLGGVQRSAPNSTPTFHCSDESDVMCYRDGSSGPMRQVCREAVPQPIDCGKNDYFNVSPSSGSYLATHWNLARSRWLATSEPAEWVDLAVPKGVIRAPAELGAKTSIPVAVQVPRGASVSRVEVFVDGDLAGTDTKAPFAVEIDPADYASGQRLRLTATVIDALGRRFETAAATTLVATPEATLTAPLPYDAVLGSVTMRADAKAVGTAKVAKVEFLVDGRVKATDSRAPFEATVAMTESVFDRPLSARVTDSKGRTAFSSTIPVSTASGGLQMEYVEAYPAGRKADVPVSLTGSEVLLWTPPAGVLEILVDREVVATVDSPADSLTAQPGYVYIASVPMPAAGSHRIEARLRSDGQTLFTTGETSISTVTTPASVALLSPDPGKVPSTLRAKAKYTKGDPDERRVEFFVDGSFAASGEEDHAAKVTLGPGTHVFSVRYRPRFSNPAFVGPAVVVTAPLKFKAAARLLRRSGDKVDLRATVTGLPPAWNVQSVRWFANGYACYDSSETDLRGTCELPEDAEWAGGQVRAVVTLGHRNGAWTATLVSEPVVLR